MTRLFKRNNKTTIAELEEYYANQDRRKTRTGTAWLMALLSLIITLAVIALVFFGGRWLYRTLTDDSNSTTSSQTSDDNDGVELPNFDGDIVGQGNSNSSSDTNVATENAGVVSDEAASTSVPNTDRVVETDSISNTGSDSSSEEIPNTGAGELLIVTPIVAGIAGYFASRKYLLKNN